MNKLKKVTVKDFEKLNLPNEDFKYLSKNSRTGSFVMKKSVPMKKRDDDLIELEIAFRKCKRVGVFS
ncbi:hypothetical protein KAI65_02500 [Candidatus Parcubacteria bacterium]|nr:hypothetical protein [Candidatus Parcubacteria bacterium]